MKPSFLSLSPSKSISLSWKKTKRTALCDDDETDKGLAHRSITNIGTFSMDRARTGKSRIKRRIYSVGSGGSVSLFQAKVAQKVVVVVALSRPLIARTISVGHCSSEGLTL